MNLVELVAEDVSRPCSPFLECNIDPDILLLVSALNSDITVTASSCSGHGIDEASVTLYVRNDGMRVFKQAISAAHRATRCRLSFEVTLVWCNEIVTADPGASWPDWTAFTLSIDRPYWRHDMGTKPPSAKQTLAISEAIARHLPGSGRPLRISRRIDGRWVGVDV